MCNKIRNAFINGQVCWACPDLYNIVLKSKYPVIIEQLFCIRVVETSAMKYIVLEKDNIMPYIKNVEHEKVVRRCQKGQLSRIC